MEKRHIFLDSNVLYFYQKKLSEKEEKIEEFEITDEEKMIKLSECKDKILKEFCDFLYYNFWDERQIEYSGCSVPDYIAVELKTNKEKSFSFLFKCVEVSITDILLRDENILVTKEEKIKKAEYSLKEKQKIFSNGELVIENNYEMYQDFKRKIHLLEFRYIFGFIIKIYEEYFKRDFLHIFNTKVEEFVEDYLELEGKKEKEKRINEFIDEISSEIKNEEYNQMKNDREFLKNMYKEEYEKIILQARNVKDREALSYGMVLKLNLIDKVLKNRTFKKKTNNLFDAYFLFSYEIGADILTGDEEMCKRFKRLLNANVIGKKGRFEILRIEKPDQTYEYFSEDVYKKIIG